MSEAIFGQKRHGGGGKFLTPMEGTFRENVEQGTPDAISRENKNGKTVWELHRETVNGHITNAWLQKGNKFGNQFMIEITHKPSGGKVVLAVGIKSSYPKKFWNIAHNLDFRQPVEVEPYYFKDKKTGKMRSGWNFFQGNKKIEPKFGKDDLPKMKISEGIEGTEYDDSESLNFLYKKWEPIAARMKFVAPAEKKEEEEDEGGEEEQQQPQERRPRQAPSQKEMDEDEVDF